MSVAHVPDPAHLDSTGNPYIAPVAGVGEIVRHHRHADGRFDILLLGRRRARLCELPFEPPFRRARAELLESSGDSGATDINALLSTAGRFIALIRQTGKALRFELPETTDAGLNQRCVRQFVADRW